MDVPSSAKGQLMEQVTVEHHKNKITEQPSTAEHKYLEATLPASSDKPNKVNQSSESNLKSSMIVKDKSSFDNGLTSELTKQEVKNLPLQDNIESEEIKDNNKEFDMDRNKVSSYGQAEKNMENGSELKEHHDNNRATNSSSHLNITGIVQRNLGCASDRSTNPKESIYNFEEEEEQSFPPRTTQTNLPVKGSTLSPQKSLDPIQGPSFPQTSSDRTAAYLRNATTSKFKHDTEEVGIVHVAKKSRPLPTNDTKQTMQNSTKLSKKKRKKKKKKKDKHITEPSSTIGVEKIDKRILSLDTSRDLYKEGYLVWGKIRGFSYWPGIITVDPMDGLTVKFMKANSDIPYSHVHFLGYERSQRAWLPESNIMEFKGIEHFDVMASKVPANSIRKKDFTPKKTLLERFEKGADTAESVLHLPFKQRLEKLDLVYVLIPSSKEKHQPKAPEEQPVVKKTKGVKRKRKAMEEDLTASSASEPNKNKRKKRDSSHVESINSKQIEKTSHMEISNEEEKHGGLNSKNKSTERKSKFKKGGRKDILSGQDKKVKKLKLKLQGKPTKSKGKGILVDSKPQKKNRKKHQTNKTHQQTSNLLVGKKDSKENLYRKNITSDPAVISKNNADLKSLSDQQGEYENTEECGTGVTVRVSSPLGSETEIRDLSLSTKADDFESDLEECSIPHREIETPNNEGSFNSEMQDFHGKGAKLPKLGSLVWGRMPGFPYWPCFVTKCPDTGEYRRLYEGYRRCDYHVQFFNWNNESGWVRNTKPWCTVEEFQTIAKSATKGLLPTCKEYKAWRPTGKVFQKWMDAFNQAQSTSGMTRRERHDKHVVFYRSKMEQSKLAMLINEGPHAKKRRKSSSIDSHSSGITTNGVTAITVSPKKKPGRKKKNMSPQQCISMKPCPKSVKDRYRSGYKGKGNSQKSSPAAQISPQEPCKLPPGWSSRIVNPDHNRISYEYKSPEGIMFSSLNDVMGYLFQQNAALQMLSHHTKDNNVNTTRAPSLPFKIHNKSNRRRSYSCSTILLPSHAMVMRGDEDKVVDHIDRNNGHNGGWFLACSDEIHYGVPKSNLEDVEYSVGNLETGSIEYLKDLSLPPSWSIRRRWKKDVRSQNFKTKSNLEYICKSSNGMEELHKFRSKLDTVQFLHGVGHPSIELEQMLKNFVKKDVLEKSIPLPDHSKDEEESVVENIIEENKFPETTSTQEKSYGECLLPSINLCEWSVDQARRHPILGRAVTPCFVDMVQLPGIFLEHPSVIVEESENEMVISDYFTKEFIAKKIIYD